MSAWSKIVGTVTPAPAPKVTQVPTVIVTKAAREKESTGVAAEDASAAAGGSNWLLLLIPRAGASLSLFGLYLLR